MQLSVFPNFRLFLNLNSARDRAPGVAPYLKGRA
jgi:hypothetical protein